MFTFPFTWTIHPWESDAKAGAWIFYYSEEWFTLQWIRHIIVTGLHLVFIYLLKRCAHFACDSAYSLIVWTCWKGKTQFCTSLYTLFNQTSPNIGNSTKSGANSLFAVLWFTNTLLKIMLFFAGRTQQNLHGHIIIVVYTLNAFWAWFNPSKAQKSLKTCFHCQRCKIWTLMFSLNTSDFFPRFLIFNQLTSQCIVS